MHRPGLFLRSCVPVPAWCELQTEAEVHGKSAARTCTGGHSSLRRIQHLNFWKMYLNMFTEIRGLWKSVRQVGCQHPRNFGHPRRWIFSGPKAAMPPSAWQVVESPHGNHVLQRMFLGHKLHPYRWWVVSTSCWEGCVRILETCQIRLDVLAVELQLFMHPCRIDPWIRCIPWRLEYMAPKALYFVLEEMLAWAPAPVLARHRYGCRILDRLRATPRFF